MAIMAIITGSLTKANYEVVRKEVDWEGKPAKGGILHMVGFDPQGHLHVTDIWESQVDFQAFVEKRLGPAFAKLRFEAPGAEIYELHNVNAYPAIDKFKVKVAAH
jgi:hypothetical protein